MTECPECGIAESCLKNEGYCIVVLCRHCTLLSEIGDMLNVVVEKIKEPFWLSQNLFEEKEVSMTEIKPGSELDRAVAKAIGLTRRDAAWWHEDGWCYRVLPSFSADLREAFGAAEEVGLLEPLENTHGQGPWASLVRGPIGWLVMKDETCIGKGNTPALAICAAILEYST